MGLLFGGSALRYWPSVSRDVQRAVYPVFEAERRSTTPLLSGDPSRRVVSVYLWR